LLLVSVVSLLAASIMAHAQAPNGWVRDDLSTPVAVTPAGPLTGDSSPTTAGDAPAVSPPPPQEGPPMALMFAGSSTAPDEITPEIAALTQGVIREGGGLADYLKCFLFVTNQLEYEHYYGCKKGALLTYVERKGNDADLATLLVAMLRAAGYTARYGFGVVALPTSGDPNGNHMQNWLATPVATMVDYSVNRGFPALYDIDGNYKALDRVWVEVDLNGTWQKLDPAVKKRVRIAPSVDVASTSGYTRAALETAAGGTLSSNAIEGVSYAGLSTYLAARATALIGYIDLNKHDADPVSILGGWRQEPFLNANSEQFLFPGIAQTVPAQQQFTALPAFLLSSVTLEVRSTAAGTPLVADHTMSMANLQGRRLSLTFTTTDATGKAQLWLDDDLLAEETTAAVGTEVMLKISIDHPHVIPGNPTLHDQFTEKSYQRGSRYALIYSFNPTQELLSARQEQLDIYRRSGFADDSREVITETLNVIGLTWMHQTELTERVIGGRLNCDMTYHHRIGRAGQLKENNGYYLDVDMQFSGVFPLDGNPAVSTQAYNAATYYASALEHAAIEQTQGADKPAVSTVKLLKLANDQPAGSRKIFYATPGNWGAVSSQLIGYSPVDLQQIQDAITAGGEVLVPQKGNLTLNQWTGAGYITRVTTGFFTTTRMGISSNLNGGYVSIWPSVVNPLYLAAWANANPTYVNTTAPSHGLTVSWDPIDLASGNFYYPATDLEVGGASPRGFTFSRQYHGGRRAVNPAGLGYGWTHNWQVRATGRSAYEPALGLGGTAYDVASAMVAVHATIDLASVAPDAQHWTLASFTAHWLADQLQDNAVSLSIGERSLQFVRRADGTWQPPAGVTMTLAANGGGWVAQERHGNTYNFDNTGKLTSIVDLWSKTLTVAYNGEKVSTVTDAYGRSLTFTYTGSQLTGLTDSTGRTVDFGYSASGDLQTVTDPETRVDRFTYDGEHRITEIRNHDQEFVAINIYDATGRLVEQQAEGNPAKAWKYFYTANAAVEENPEGGKTTSTFDLKKRLVRRQDAAGRVATATYDGQDRVTQTKTPMGLTTIRTYDRFHNLLTVKDPDNKTTSFGYDAQHRLTSITDPLTHATIITPNAQHQPLTIKNALNETTTNTYNPTTGTLATTTAPAAPASTTFGYNGRDELTTTNFPGGGTETITRNIYGDPLTVQDARFNTTSYTYNLRRQPLTVTRPGLPAVVHTYDNQRRLASTQDARGFTTSYNYSSLGKLLVTTLPGGATITDAYDSRDWRVSTTAPKLPAEAAQTTTFLYYASGELAEQRDPLNRPTSFEYDGDSRQTEMKDALNHAVGTSYNTRGLVFVTTDPLSQFSVNTYDGAGRRTDFLNRRFKNHHFTYDNADRLLTSTTPNSRTTAQSWNTRGLVGTQTEPSTQQTTLTYDARGRVQTRADAVGTITYGYDHNNNLLTVTQGAVTITRTYDALNRVATYNDGRGHTLTYGYDGNHNLTSLTYEAGKTVTYTYNNRNQLTQVQDWTGRITGMTYDGAGRLLTTTRHNGTVRTNIWDAAGQLISVNDRHAMSGLPLVGLRMKYDAAGRLTDKLEKPSWTSVNSTSPRTVTYNDDNQILTVNGQGVTHDADGNITNGPSPLTGGAVVWSWNARNQLTNNGVGVTFTYDAEGLRATANATTSYVNDPHGAFSNLLFRIRSNGTKTYYIYGPLLLYEIEETSFNGHPADYARYYHYDHLGSTIALSEGSGTVLTRLTYSAYGILANSSGETNNLPPFLWNGSFGVRSDPGGLQFMRARYFHPTLGRFLSEDPLGLAAGPNVYAYADGNPIMWNDPLGLATDGRKSIGGAIGSFYLLATGAPGASEAFIPQPIREVWGKYERWADQSRANSPAWVKSIDRMIESTGGVGLGPVGMARILPLVRTTPQAVNAVGRARTVEQALSSAERYLGTGYKEIAPGVFRSADETLQFRMTTSDLKGRGMRGQPHVHFERIDPITGKPLRNLHVPLIDP